MEDDKTDDPAPAEPARPIDGRREFEAALQMALDDCALAQAPEIWLCDPDFAAWPLGQIATIEALTRWIGSKRRLTLIAADYSGFLARFPRWVAWRRQWSHVVRCLAVHEELAAQVPTLLLAPSVAALQLHDRERVRGRLYREAVDIRRCGDVVDALSQRSDESFPVTTLGL